MQNLLEELETLLSSDQSLLDEDGKLNKNPVNDRAANLDPDFLKLLLASEPIRRHFFADVEGTLVFDKVKFQEFVANKAFLPDSYTAFRNRIGLTDSAGRYLKSSRDVVLAWPYKDCVLEGGMTQEDAKRDEIFWNTTLAPDDITRLFEPKVLKAFGCWDAEAAAAGQAKPVGSAELSGTNLLIKGNNLLALHSLKPRYAAEVDLIYIDPPYNPPSNANTFLYNNRFGRSAWLTFMRNRLEVAKTLLKRKGCLIVAIDDNEFYHLGSLLEEMFPGHEVHCITIVHNPRGVQGTNFSYTHEYAFFVIPKGVRSLGHRKIEDADIWWANLRNWGGESERSTAKNCFYPIYVENGEIVGFGDVSPDDLHPRQNEPDGERIAVYPIDVQGVERKWRYARQSVEEVRHLLRAKSTRGRCEIELGKDFGQYRTVWQDTRYDANEYGTKILKDLVPDCKFAYPKSIWTVFDCLKAVVGENPDALVLDFFAGSGTTGHALYELNKTDAGSRRFILIEQLGYIEDCTKQRLLELIRRGDGGASTLVYFELAEWNEALGQRIREAGDEASLERVTAEMRANGYWRYRVDQTRWDWGDFAELGFDERKQLLLDSLDANHLYVNYGDIDDEAYAIGADDIALNKAFYGSDL